MSPKNPAAVALGRKGGQATAQNRTPEQRSEAARKAVKARWEKILDKLEAKIETHQEKQHEARQKKARAKKRLGANLRD